MQVVYNPAHAPQILLPSRQSWKNATRDAAWGGLRHPRSRALGAIDTALHALEADPSDAAFVTLRNNMNNWYATKVDAAGVFHSRRDPAATPVRALINQHHQFLLDRNTLKQRIEQQILNSFNWKTRVLCAELYVGDAFGPAWAPLTQQALEALEWEARLSSGWAHHPPAQIDDWSNRGRMEAASLAAWPNLPAGGSGHVLRARMPIDLNIMPAAWPPWGVFVRKGLFCHSCAALAVHAIYANRAVLQAGLTCQIRSIDVVHQQPAVPGGISHWWVCVNRPVELRLTARTVRFDTLSDYKYLSLVGGFVVDIWGTLWADQEAAPEQRALSNAATALNCVIARPYPRLLGDTATRIHARELY